MHAYHKLKQHNYLLTYRGILIMNEKISRHTECKDSRDYVIKFED